MECEFTVAFAIAIDNNDYINPPTSLPLMNPGACAHGGVDIHNNWYGSSSNEF